MATSQPSSNEDMSMDSDLWLGANGATEFNLTESLPCKHILGRGELPEHISIGLVLLISFEIILKIQLNQSSF
jgi:hypothetical protein